MGRMQLLYKWRLLGNLNPSQKDQVQRWHKLAKKKVVIPSSKEERGKKEGGGGRGGERKGKRGLLKEKAITRYK